MSEKILVLEDEEKWQDVLKIMLRHTEFELYPASTCEEAEALLTQYQFSLVIINMNLTELTTDQLGFDLLEILMREYPSVPRIAMTNQIGGPIFSTYLPFGVNEVLPKKTITRPQLIEVMQDAIRRRGQPKRPYDRVSVCRLLDKHTTDQHVRQLQQRLNNRLPGEQSFSSYSNLRGETKIERLDSILEVLESYQMVFAACQFLVEIKPDDASLREAIEEIDWTR